MFDKESCGTDGIFLAQVWVILSNAMLQLPCSTCVVDTGVAPERCRQERVDGSHALSSCAQVRHLCQRHKFNKLKIELLRMIHTEPKKKSHWLRSLSLANTALTGFEAELKMNGPWWVKRYKSVVQPCPIVVFNRACHLEKPKHGQLAYTHLHRSAWIIRNALG